MVDKIVTRNFLFHLLVKIAICGASILILTQDLNASDNLIFEGYSRVVLGGVQAGYQITRYEFDKSKKQFIATYFITTNQLGGNIMESLKAQANEKFEPVSYMYTSLTGGVSKTVDASFKNGKMTATVTLAGKPQKVEVTLPKGTFLSIFLGYMILNSPEKMKTFTRYPYKAIAEEDATVIDGVTLIQDREEFNGIKAFKLKNEFKGDTFFSYVTDQGEVLSTKNPVNGVSTELVAKQQQATEGFSFNSNNIRTLFGDIPKGEKNIVFEKSKSEPKEIKKAKTEQNLSEKNNKREAH